MIPFGWLPGHWGLKGKTREIAKAEYELEGDELELRLAEINYGTDSKEYSLLKLGIDHKSGEVSDNEYEKGVATANEESWVKIINITPNSSQPNHGEMELDWNEFFVEELRAAGYEAAADEQLVDMWLADLCRNIAMEQFSGIGDFDEKVPDQFIKRTDLDDDDGRWVAG